MTGPTVSGEGLGALWVAVPGRGRTGRCPQGRPLPAAGAGIGSRAGGVEGVAAVSGKLSCREVEKTGDVSADSRN